MFKNKGFSLFELVVTLTIIGVLIAIAIDKLTKSGKTTRGQLPKAIAFDVTGESAVIGSRETIAGQSGSAHEFGGEYLAQTYDPRPFMTPALEGAADRFASDWQGTIGE